MIGRYTTAAATAVPAVPHACTLAQLPYSVYNMGGPERLSRHDMAVAVAQHCGHSTKAIKAANTASVKRCGSNIVAVQAKAASLCAVCCGLVWSVSLAASSAGHRRIQAWSHPLPARASSITHLLCRITASPHHTLLYLFKLSDFPHCSTVQVYNPHLGYQGWVPCPSKRLPPLAALQR